MVKIANLKQVRQVLAKVSGNVVGVGVTAWTRSGLADLVPQYRVVAIKPSQDVEWLRKDFPVEILGDWQGKLNTAALLEDRRARDYLRLIPGPKWLFVYKISPNVEESARDLGYKLIGNQAAIRDPYEDKRQFREVGEQVGLPMIPGETLTIEDLDEEKMISLLRRWKGVVLQLTDYWRGGGVGTFFINSLEDFDRFSAFVTARRRKRALKWVNATKFITGVPASMSGCVTRYGVLMGVLQGQIVDQPELAALAGRFGVWLGHDWSGQRFSERVQMKAEKLVRDLGAHMARKGYKGIFGMDLVVDDNEQAWPIECNSRYTGAFPAYTWASMKNGEIPLDAWHLLEFMGVPYEMDVGKVQAISRQPKEGAQILMHNLEPKSSVRVEGGVKSGVYKQGEGWVRDGWNLLHIKEPNEFVVTDGVPFKGATLKPAERLGRLLFNRAIVDKSGRLLPEIQEVVRTVYRRFNLQRI